MFKAATLDISIYFRVNFITCSTIITLNLRYKLCYLTMPIYYLYIDIHKTLSAVLHLGNIKFAEDSHSEQAMLPNDSGLLH